MLQALAVAANRLLICSSSELKISSDSARTWVGIPTDRFVPNSALAISGPNLLITEYYPQVAPKTYVRPLAEMSTVAISASGAGRLAPAFASDFSPRHVHPDR